MTVKEFVEKHGIRAVVRRAPENPNFVEDSRQMFHYSVTLERGTRRLNVGKMSPNGETAIPEKSMHLYFSTGTGWTRPPNAADVLECLISDASSIDQSFEDWANDLGFNPDSRADERAYNTIRAQAKKLQCFLGDDLLTEAMECEEDQ